MNNSRWLLALLLLITMSGCSTSWQAYDKDDPDEYYRYWQDEENRKNSAFYPLTEEYQKEQEGLKR